MRQRRVTIVHDGGLLSECLVLLVKGQPDLEVVVVDAADPEVTDRVSASQPDVIVVPGYNGASDLSRVAEILRDNPGTRVISFGLDKTEINAYQSEGPSFASLESLLSVIGRGS